MGWLRIDDGFTTHPKFAGWTPAERWAWLELLSYCARYRTEGRIPDDLSLLPRDVNAKLLEKGERSRLIDREEDGLRVHDWDDYNAPKDPTAADRQREWRKRNRTAALKRGGRWNATREAVFARDDGVCIDCGKREVPGWNADHEPHRDDLIEAGKDVYDPEYIVTRCHSCHARKTRFEAIARREASDTSSDTASDTSSDASSDNGVTPVVTSSDTNRDLARGQARASRPVPNKPLLNSAAAIATTRADAAAEPLKRELAAAGIVDPRLVARALVEPARAAACLTAAKTRAARNPGGLWRTMFESGETPPDAEHRPAYPDVDPVARVVGMIGNGAITDRIDIVAELGDAADSKTVAELETLLEASRIPT